MKRILSVSMLLAFLWMLSACAISLPELPPLPGREGAAPASTPAPATPAATAAPEPSEAPVPAAAEEYPPGITVVVEGKTLPSRSLTVQGLTFVKLPEWAEALGLTLTGEGETVRFGWQGEDCSLAMGEAALIRAGKRLPLPAAPLLWEEDCWAPVEALCEALGISLYYCYGEEYALYCTAAAGDWSYPAGWTVPILMYHAVADEIWGAESMFVSPSQMEEQLQWLQEQGYETLWFSDLREPERYDKPIILTFDDGYEDNYRNLFPLLQKYGVKATVFLITGLVGDEHYLDAGEIREMSESGLVEFQSKSRTAPQLTLLSEEEQRRELVQSKADIVTLTGKEPYVFCYPQTSQNDTTRALVSTYYRFGVLDGGMSFVTGQEETLIPRYPVIRGRSREQLEALLN